MKIGIVGSGNMGASMGKAWARKSHQVLFSFSRELAQLRATAGAAGPNARAGTPAEAAAFAEVILLAVP
jgi:predicted dinucleotide-binding enzyme